MFFLDIDIDKNSLSILSIQTDSWCNSTEIRKRKNDTIDSILIAYLLRYEDFVESTLSNEYYLSLKNLTRFRSYLISSTGDFNCTIS